MTKIIVALDYTNPLDALELTAKLRGHVDGFKINHALWSQSVYIKDYCEGGELFLDLKLWDTPNTVKTILQKVVDKGATMTTICTLNNEAVFEEAQKFSSQIKLLGVTYLTSWNSTDLKNIINQNAMLMWRENINKMKKYNFAGVVCSPKDLDTVNTLAPDMLKVCPGIGQNKGQTRTTSAKEAQDLGANYLIIGRTITQSYDPVTELRHIRNSLSA